MTNPTVSSIYDHLVNDNDWAESEFQEFITRHGQHVLPNGNTTLTHDQWESLAMDYMHG